MKAWLVKSPYEDYSTVVFAETRGKARNLGRYTDGFEDFEFCEIEVRRVPQLDKYYKEGKIQMDWLDPADRIALVKEANFTCADDWYDAERCHECLAKEFCDGYQEYEENCE